MSQIVIYILLLSSICFADSIMTVSGPIPADQFGPALVHEHILVDFGGADITSPDRWNDDEVAAVMRPYLLKLTPRRVRGFIDCTPAYLGRDVKLLKRLADETGLKIVTNTGYYGAGKDKYVPKQAYEKTAEQLAAIWTGEWNEGIDGTKIRPGFIKTAVDKIKDTDTHLSEIDRKLVQAAALCHLQTGLTIACHSGQLACAKQVLQTVQCMGVDPSALIIVHANSIKDIDALSQLAASGVWLEYDGVRSNKIQWHVQLIQAAIEGGYVDQILLSHDAGWYSAGEPGGNAEKIRGYDTIWKELIPASKEANIPPEIIEKILTKNAANAFTIKIRKATNKTSAPN